MCRMCDGASWEDIVAEESLAIAVNGYVLCGVAGADHEPWVYTIGLLDAIGHPELIVAGVDPRVSARLLNALARAVLDGERLQPGFRIDLGSGRFACVGAIDPAQYRSETFAHWYALRSADVIHAPELSAVQIVLESAEHEDAQPLLSDPNERVGRPPGVRANRAARRQRSRKPRDRWRHQ